MSQAGLRPALSLRIYKESAKCFGPGIAELLRRVQKAGSLRAAASDMGMAYSKAWRILNETEQALGGVLLLTRTTGGPHGGGAVLTPAGVDLLKRYTAYEAALQAEAKRLFAVHFPGREQT